MLYASTIGADPPPGALTFTAIIDAVSNACATDPARLSGLAMNFLAAAISYYRIRERQVGDIKSSTYDARLAGVYHTLALTANDVAHRAGGRTATCLQIIVELRQLLERHRADPRDQAYVEMNLEIRAFYDKAMEIVGAGQPMPMPRATARKLAAVGLLGLTLALGLASAVVIVRNR